MSRFEPSLAGVPRDQLERRLVAAEAELFAAKDRLTRAVQHGHEQGSYYIKVLAEREESLKRAQSELAACGIRLRGWLCTNELCGAFKGAEKVLHTHCRCCGARRPW